MSTLRFCAFVITELICGFGIYAGTLMRHFRVVEIGVAAAVIALISYTAAEACIEMNAQDKGVNDGGENRIREG